MSQDEIQQHNNRIQKQQSSYGNKKLNGKISTRQHQDNYVKNRNHDNQKQRKTQYSKKEKEEDNSPKVIPRNGVDLISSWAKSQNQQ